jgi:hypothetical protein
VLQIVERTFLLSRADAGDSEHAVPRPTDTGIDVEAGEDLLDHTFPRCGRSWRGGTVSG